MTTFSAALHPYSRVCDAARVDGLMDFLKSDTESVANTTTTKQIKVVLYPNLSNPVCKNEAGTAVNFCIVHL